MPVHLIERESHLAELNDLLHRTAQGGGRLALVSGAVASGKSELLNRFTEQAIDSGALVLEATGSRAERDLPFGILRKILDSAGLSPDDRTRALEFLDTDGPKNTGPAPVGVMSHVCSVLLQLAKERTLVVAVDDIQCADEYSLQFVLHLARRVRQAKILVVLTESTRMSREHQIFYAELLRQPRCSRIRLHMLSEAGTARLLSEQFRTATAARLVPYCQGATGGNPLLLRALLEDRRADGECDEVFQRLRPAEAFAQAVLGCLHRGEPDVLLIARGAAVLGDAHSTRLLGRLLDLAVPTVEQGVQDLLQCGVLHDGEFRESAARTAVLEAAPQESLSALHRRAALLLHGEGSTALEVARHLVAARGDADRWTVPVLREAAEYAVVEDDLEFALRCLELAHDACGEGPPRAAVKARFVGIVWRLSPAAAEGHLAQLATELTVGRLSARDLPTAVSYLSWSGRLDTAADAVTGLVRSETPTGTAEETAALGAARWLSVLSPPLRARIPSAGAPTAPGRGDGRSGTAGDAYAQTAGALATALGDGPADKAVEEAERVLQRYHLSDNTLQPLAFALMSLIYAGRLDLALSWCERLLSECAARRVPAWQGLLSGVRGEIDLRRGDLPGAANHARAAMSLMSVQSWGPGIALPLSTLIQAETGMGRHDEAMNLLEQPVPEGLLQTLPGLHYLRARGRCHLATGRFHAALGDFVACGELLAAWKMDNPELVPWRLDAAEAWLALGEKERARALAQEELRRGSGGKALRGTLLLMLARTGDLKHGLPILKEAVEVLEGGEDRLQLAVALGELGRRYRALGEFNRARMLVRKAWHVAKACGAEPLCRQLIPSHGEGGELAAPAQTGEEPDPPRETEALTEAEARVALLAAHGNTNREIASKLFVTVSTVEQHLTRIYRKLKVKRRRDLPARLSDSSLSGIA
ncbi:AAA family ATPase [Streptomyces sp. NPDC006923]|uniref:helix-turn-helix transcriptional regulator n=1 Tax=Streptomyces sp. NPDC006923 TaxID=3155355 RepID=UPI0033D7FAE3